jgi:hypothetical protein
MIGFGGKLFGPEEQMVGCKSLFSSMRRFKLKPWMESSLTIGKLFPTTLLLSDYQILLDWALVHLVQ